MKVLFFFLFIYNIFIINTKEQTINNQKEFITKNNSSKIRKEEETNKDKNKKDNINIEDEDIPKTEKEIFEKKIEIFTLGDFTTFEIPAKSGENIYYTIKKNCTLKFAFYLSDTKKLINLKLSGPDGNGGSRVYNTFSKKNYLYYEHKAIYPGRYMFYLDNVENGDITEASFAIRDSLKVDKNIGMKKIGKITEYLDDIDGKINKMRLKQNIINQKTDTHNESVNKHNKEILIYSMVEVGIMALILIGQLYYIKNKVNKV